MELFVKIFLKPVLLAKYTTENSVKLLKHVSKKHFKVRKNAWS
ncbi:hypothetical protein HNO87_002502 [Acinetobacter schindleri]|nr:hypothetical protein [Acinetobacter schindleri]